MKMVWLVQFSFCGFRLVSFRKLQWADIFSVHKHARRELGQDPTLRLANKILYNYPPKERWIVVNIYLDTKRRGIFPPLFTNPELGDSWEGQG